MSRIRKSIETESRLIFASGCRAVVRRGWGMTGNGYGISFWGDGNILKLDSGEYTQNVQLYTLKGWIVWYVNYTSIKIFKNVTLATSLAWWNTFWEFLTPIILSLSTQATISSLIQFPWCIILINDTYPSKYVNHANKLILWFACPFLVSFSCPNRLPRVWSYLGWTDWILANSKAKHWSVLASSRYRIPKRPCIKELANQPAGLVLFFFARSNLQ